MRLPRSACAENDGEVNAATSSRVAVVLACVALLLLICAEAIRVVRGESIDIFHVFFGLGLLAFTIHLLGRSSRKD